jgi:hypothetical protein
MSIEDHVVSLNECNNCVVEAVYLYTLPGSSDFEVPAKDCVALQAILSHSQPCKAPYNPIYVNS